MYKVTEQKRFSFKYLYLVSKVYVIVGWPGFNVITHVPFLLSRQDAIDVENADNYHEMVTNLANLNPDKIKIMVDMKVIQHCCGQVVSLLKHYSILNII